MATNSMSCPLEATLAVLNNPWKVRVIRILLEGIQRFGQLHRALAGLSQPALTKQLRELETDQLIRRTIHNDVVSKVEYSLTPLGESLEPVVVALHEWGKTYTSKVANKRLT